VLKNTGPFSFVKMGENYQYNCLKYAYFYYPATAFDCRKSKNIEVYYNFP